MTVSNFKVWMINGTWGLFRGVNSISKEDMIELVDELNDRNIIPGIELVRLMHKDEFLMLRNDLQVPLRVLSTIDGTLDDYISEYSNHITTYQLLMETRFYTEEEIIAHPEMFDPEVFVNAAVLWYSRDTLKMLNRVHGRNGKARSFRYKPEKMTLRSILFTRVNNDMHTTMSDALYLKEKTNTTNKEFMMVLSEHNSYSKKFRDTLPKEMQSLVSLWLTDKEPN